MDLSSASRVDAVAIRAPVLTDMSTLRRALVICLAVATVGVPAVLLRTWNIGATFESSDQAAMPYMVRHSFGIRWIFAHEYGPILPLMQKVYATVCGRRGFSVGESCARVPVALAGLALVGLSYALLRRLRASRVQGWAGALCAAALPCLVCDAHYPWGYQALILLTGAVALWALLAYFDERRPAYLLLSAVGLLVHCLSGLYAFALPLTMLACWLKACWRPASSDRPVRWTTFLVGFVLPCGLALLVIFGSWAWTGGGQIGRMLAKEQIGGVGFHPGQILQLPSIWMEHLGPVFGVATGVALVWATALAGASVSLRVLALWAWAALLPVVLLTDWNCTGYPNYYFMEPVFACSLIGVCFLVRLVRTGPSWRRAAAALVLTVSLGTLALGSMQVALPGLRMAELTGIRTGWGDAREDSGAKAAGWYVRQYVPDNAIVLALHGRSGMELPVAEYYCGRKVLAHYDVLDEAVAPLAEAMAGRVGVIIAEPRHRKLVAGLGFSPVAVITRGGNPVREVHARAELHLLHMDLDCAIVNPAYDELFHSGTVPVPLPAATGFLDVLKIYQQKVHELRATRFAGRS